MRSQLSKLCFLVLVLECVHELVKVLPQRQLLSYTGSITTLDKVQVISNGKDLDGYTTNGDVEAQVQVKRTSKSDLVVLLDLDECLVHSRFFSANGTALTHSGQIRRKSSETPPSAPSLNSTFNFSLSDDFFLHVYERPHLREFLQAVSEKYEVHIFTAGLELYNGPVVKMMDPNGTIFKKAWYRESCTYDPELKKYVKDLNFAWGGEKLKRTVLVDNSMTSFLPQPENGILVSPFYGDDSDDDDSDDDTLSFVLDLLKELDSLEDVRPFLKNGFQLRGALWAYSQRKSQGRGFEKYKLSNK